MCKGSTADSDSVCLGSNPSSAAIKNAPLKSRGAFFIAANSGYDPVFCPTGKTWVRIPRTKVGVLAHQTQCVGIFAKGEHPSSVPMGQSPLELPKATAGHQSVSFLFLSVFNKIISNHAIFWNPTILTSAKNICYNDIANRFDNFKILMYN